MLLLCSRSGRLLTKLNYIHHLKYQQLCTTTHGTYLTGTPPKESRVVICGGGIMGSAVAYHLALSGWGPHTVIIEQSK